MSAAGVVIERANPRPLPIPLVAVAGILTVGGLISFVIGLGVDVDTTWRAFHVNFVYFATLSQAGLFFAAILVIVGARWPGPIRHIAAGLAAWVPVSFVLFLVTFAFSKDSLYSWIEHPIDAKAPWLNVTRLFVVDLAILGVLAWLSLRFLRLSVRPALGGAAQNAQGTARRLFERWTAGWRGDEEERTHSQRQLVILAPIIVLLYAYGYTVIAFDQVMSLSPTWFSNLFGAYFGWGGLLNAVAVTALIAVLHRNSPGFKGEITADRMHDLGKLIFAFSIFWMYLFWSQYFVIWYGNLPEETQFLEARLGSQFLQDTWHFVGDRLNEPYVKLSLSVWACCWIVPFWVLLGQKPKKTPAILGSVGAVVALGFWLERNVLIWPSLVPDDPNSWFGPIQIGIALGFLGAFTLVYLLYSRVFPSLIVPDRS